MDDLSEALQREIAQCDYEVARFRFAEAPADRVRRAELRAAHRATRFSQAYRSGDPRGDLNPELEGALLTPLDFVALSMWRALCRACARAKGTDDDASSIAIGKE